MSRTIGYLVTAAATVLFIYKLPTVIRGVRRVFRAAGAGAIAISEDVTYKALRATELLSDAVAEGRHLALTEGEGAPGSGADGS